MRMSEHEPETTEQVVEALPVEKSAHADPHELGLELPVAKDEAIQLLLDELRASRDEASSYLDDLKRVAADFDNYRKRTTRDSANTLDRATEKVVQGLMPVLDSFDAALSAQPRTDAEKQLYAGMLNTREQLLGTLASEGLQVIPTVGEPFDPEIHEPVGAPEGHGSLMVAEELRRGYRLRGKVLRAALVALETTA